ncbi:OmpH family outer membrane protein [Roseobacter sinensis]|uniref:OmpH family outer membrane protein n=1 Tax=Roseobacter sinensis TaxID=2931391 RepID=A0ABT3BBN7_9RHOB|nr:OmpH family outer membrane protein [Roseobacter sp. WL0113]MCV3270972.1 OmpH family outer membrane protein [Roseobacter sp. WL0113]
MGRLTASLALVLTAWVWLLPGEAAAQGIGPVQSPILTIDSDRLFSESDFGKQTVAEFEARGAELAAENRRIEEALEAEEQALTEQRATMDPAEFRTLADAFDEKVQTTRRAQDAKNRELSQDFEQRRNVFLNAAAPVLEGLMREAGAAVIMDKRALFLSSNAIDITDLATERLNAVLGDGRAPLE